MQDLVQAFYLWLGEGVVGQGFVAEGYFGVCIYCILSGRDCDVELGDYVLVGVGDLHVGDLVFLVPEDVLFHALFCSLGSSVVLYLGLLFDSFLFEVFEHLKVGLMLLMLR